MPSGGQIVAPRSNGRVMGGDDTGNRRFLSDLPMNLWPPAHPAARRHAENYTRRPIASPARGMGSPAGFDTFGVRPELAEATRRKVLSINPSHSDRRASARSRGPSLRQKRVPLNRPQFLFECVVPKFATMPMFRLARWEPPPPATKPVRRDSSSELPEHIPPLQLCAHAGPGRGPTKVPRLTPGPMTNISNARCCWPRNVLVADGFGAEFRSKF